LNLSATWHFAGVPNDTQRRRSTHDVSLVTEAQRGERLERSPARPTGHRLTETKRHLALAAGDTVSQSGRREGYERKDERWNAPFHSVNAMTRRGNGAE
jgi:hypothetical protein